MKRLAQLSQNLLRNPTLVKKLLDHTNIATNDVVYDIGAGSGVITSVLAPLCRTVVAVELDPRMANKLHTNMQQFSNVLVYQADFLLMQLPTTPYKVFASIPFSLSAAIVGKLTQATSPPEAIYLIVQKEFAHKLLPESNRYTSLLAILLGVEFVVRIRRHLKQTDFMPQPQVTPVLLEILHRKIPLVPTNDLTDFREFVSQMYENSRSIHKAIAPQVSHRQFLAFTRAEKLSVSAKPSQLQLTQWLGLYRLAIGR